MKTPEDKVLDPIMDFLESKDVWFIKHKAGSNNMGIPDLLCCYKSYFIGIEVKRKNKGFVKVQQKLNLNHIAINGGIAVIANDLKIVKNIFDIIDHPQKYYKKDLMYTLYVNCGFNVMPNVYSDEQFQGVWDDILLKIVGEYNDES